jgi:hypothetical protein
MFSMEGIRATFSRVRYRKKYVIKYKLKKKYYSTFVLRYVLHPATKNMSPRKLITTLLVMI